MGKGRSCSYAAAVGLFVIILFPLSVFGWTSFISSEGDYKVFFPQKPRLKQAVHKSFVGNIDEVTYFSNGSGGLVFNVEYSDLPGIAITFGGENGILDKAKKGLLKENGGQEQNFSDISLQGYAGKELEYRFTAPSGKAGYGKARFYLVKKRLYVLVATSEKPNPPQWNKFFGSFTLLNP